MEDIEKKFTKEDLEQILGGAETGGGTTDCDNKPDRGDASGLTGAPQMATAVCDRVG